MTPFPAPKLKFSIVPVGIYLDRLMAPEIHLPQPNSFSPWVFYGRDEFIQHTCHGMLSIFI